jgi:hypothetical protein
VPNGPARPKPQARWIRCQVGPPRPPPAHPISSLDPDPGGLGAGWGMVQNFRPVAALIA